nr:late embryogenesis abundant protein LEA77 [Pinus tabuliformis]
MAGRLLSVYRLSSLLTDIRISHARQYTAAAADAMRSSGVADAMRSGAGGGNDKRRAFWMRDPATGDWIPEDHFGETDTAELRQKLLSRK